MSDPAAQLTARGQLPAQSRQGVLHLGRIAVIGRVCDGSAPDRQKRSFNPLLAEAYILHYSPRSAERR